jgi:hypothetical protein
MDLLEGNLLKGSELLKGLEVAMGSEMHPKSCLWSLYLKKKDI